MKEEEWHVLRSPRDIFTQENHLQVPDEIVSYVSDVPPEYIPYKGILIHIRGATYPKKGNPTPEAIGALNIIKELIKQATRYPIAIMFVNKEKLINSFNNIFYKTFAPYRLLPEYLCPAAYHVFLLGTAFLTDMGFSKEVSRETALNLAQIPEYDDAYRYRMQDMATEMDIQAFKRNPQRELFRLLEMYIIRESGHVFPRVDTTLTRVAQQVKHFVTLFILVLFIPKVKRSFRKNAHLIDGIRYDEADKYWAYLKDGDYQFGGKTYTERTQGWQIPVPYKITGL